VDSNIDKAGRCSIENTQQVQNWKNNKLTQILFCLIRQSSQTKLEWHQKNLVSLVICETDVAEITEKFSYEPIVLCPCIIRHMSSFSAMTTNDLERGRSYIGLYVTEVRGLDVQGQIVSDWQVKKDSKPGLCPTLNDTVVYKE